MKGFMAKDLAIIKQRGKIFIFLIIWGIVMNFVMSDVSFAVGWMVMVSVIASMSTISYDEYDNCMPFLMSLPVTRKNYALSKYLFSGLCGAAAWIVSVLVALATSSVSGKSFVFAEELPGMVLFIAITMIMIAVAIPPQLKWGAEKGRMVMLALFGALFVTSFIAAKFAGGFEKIAAGLENYSMGGFVAGALIFSAVLAAVSAAISVRIMEKKEF